MRSTVDHIGRYIADIIPDDASNYLEIGTYQIANCPDLVDRISQAVLADLKDKHDKIQRFAPSQYHLAPSLFSSPEAFLFPPKEGISPQPFRKKSLLETKGSHWAYLEYLEKQCPELSEFFNKNFPFRIPEAARKKHTYILGGSGSGKSELLKVLMYAYIRQSKRTETVILFDPHGDIAEQVGHWKEHRGGEHLIYFDPTLENGVTPCINPLDVPQNLSTNELNYMAECLTEVFKEIVSAESSISANMGTLLKAVITVLLKKPKATLKDLQRFMRDEENAELLDYAIEHSPEGQRHFFEHAFSDKTYKPTKNALYTKIQDLLNSQVFYDITIGESTLNIRELMDSKKTVIFNLAKGKIGEQSSSAFGRFLLGMMQGFSFQRQDTPESERVPTHVFLDEFHNFVTPSIQTVLDESRKYGLYLTLVQQFFGQKTDTAVRASIMNNTAIKICGTGESASLESMAKVMSGATKTDLQRCEIGEFYIRVKKQGGVLQQDYGTHYARPFKTPTFLLGFNHAMTAEQWQQLKSQQINKYYRPIGETTNSEMNEGHHPDVFSSQEKPTIATNNQGLIHGLKKKALETAIKMAKKSKADSHSEIPAAEQQNRPSEMPSAPQTKPSDSGVPPSRENAVEANTDEIAEKPSNATKKKPKVKAIKPKFKL